MNFPQLDRTELRGKVTGSHSKNEITRRRVTLFFIWIGNDPPPESLDLVQCFRRNHIARGFTVECYRHSFDERAISLSHLLLLNRLNLFLDLVPVETLGKAQIIAGLQVRPEPR